MGLLFRNSSNSTVYVAYAYQNSDCRPITYAKIGWFRLDPGQLREVWSGFAGGRTFFYYAESDRLVWTGPYFTQVPFQAFHWCWNVGCTTCRNVGMNRVDVGNFVFNHTVNLIGIGSSQRKSSENVTIALPTNPTNKKPVPRQMPTTMPKKLRKGCPVLKNRVTFPLKVRRQT
ncbi:DUF1036 domain-containing protein [Laceyella sacchari]|jgi:Protein of unknown function (DUF1036)|uniref:DUF1036 domain-containing protein n=1 Tax=Laceyella tengchongensis TaxID=574699 RepID=UPI000C9F5B11|nr:DUF1036 domain-containing protein [Laceyella sacchari]MRG27948.1 DUF1036 domain-containing protein [Laceyella tengchongensis]